MLTLGRWARRHKLRASAAAVLAVMQPTEAHHTGTGRVGKSRISYVLPASQAPTQEQREAMLAHDAEQPVVYENCTVRRTIFSDLTGNYGRIIRRNCVPSEKITRATVTIHHGEVVGYERAASLLILAADGSVLVDRLNEKYDDRSAVLARMREVA